MCSSWTKSSWSRGIVCGLRDAESRGVSLAAEIVHLCDTSSALTRQAIQAIQAIQECSRNAGVKSCEVV